MRWLNADREEKFEPERSLVSFRRISAVPEETFVENTPWWNTLQLPSLGSMEIREVLATNLRRYRRAAGLSQEELAHRAAIDRTYISALERCQYAAGIDVVDRLARELNVEAADLLRRPTAGIEKTPVKPKSR